MLHEATFAQIRWSPCNSAIDTEIMGDCHLLHSTQLVRFYSEWLSLVGNNYLKRSCLPHIHYGNVGFRFALLILTLHIFIVCFTVYMLTVANEILPFSKSRQLWQNREWIILVTTNRLQIWRSCFNSVQLKRDQDLSSGRRYSLWNNLVISVTLEL